MRTRWPYNLLCRIYYGDHSSSRLLTVYRLSCCSLIALEFSYTPDVRRSNWNVLLSVELYLFWLCSSVCMAARTGASPQGCSRNYPCDGRQPLPCRMRCAVVSRCICPKACGDSLKTVSRRWCMVTIHPVKPLEHKCFFAADLSCMVVYHRRTLAIRRPYRIPCKLTTFIDFWLPEGWRSDLYVHGK